MLAPLVQYISRHEKDSWLSSQESLVCQWTDTATQLHSILPVQGLRGDSCASRSLLVIKAGWSHITHSRWISYHTQQVRLTSHTAGGSHITHSRWVSHHMLQVGLISQRAGGSHITHTSEKPGLCIQEENMWLKLSTDLLMLILFQQHGRESLQKATEALGLTQSHDALLLQRLAGQGHHSVCVVELCVVVQYHYILDTQQKNHIYIYINLTILWIIVIF